MGNRDNPKDWKASETILVYKETGLETDVAPYRPIGLANTLYKLWTRLITNTLYEHAEVNSLLSNMQAGFCKKHDTIQQLQNVLMTLKDAKLYEQDIYALIVDFTSALNTTDHDKLRIIMFDLGLSTDAIDAVKNLYYQAHTRIRLPLGCTEDIPVLERGTIQGDTLSPFLFLIYMETLLHWLHAGNRGYMHGHADTSTPNNKAKNCTSSRAFADDLICLSGSYPNLRLQAIKFTQCADWAHLIISGNKTKVTCMYHSDGNKTLRGNTSVADFAHHQLTDKVVVQGQAA